jgi:glutaminyl-peptide cyclotransferase
MTINKKSAFFLKAIALAAASCFYLGCYSCSERGHGNHDKMANQGDKDNSGVQSSYNSKIIKPENGATFKIGDLVEIQLDLNDKGKKPDSVQFFVDEKLYGSINSGNLSFKLNTSKCSVGTKKINTIAFSKGKTEENNLNIRLLSDIKPKEYTYKIINTYPHDKSAFTQGLVYEDGIFYEGTGLNGSSSLRKVKPETGKILKSVDLPSEYFGEGIAVVNNKIFQITWKSQTAFVYDKESFTLLNKINYPIAEGWGLTCDGKRLIMSDGSASLYFMDIEYFNETGHIEVYDDKGEVNRLNELEYINGSVYANIWETNKIAIINPNTGKVTGIINLESLLKKTDKYENTDVLNGIAYDLKNNRLFVTGKNWPKLFEIKLVDK